MAVYNELDKWAWDIEQELKSNDLQNRSYLQRKLMTIERIRDKIHALHMKNHYYYNGHCPEPLSCRERVFKIPNPPKGDSNVSQL